jgi:hypothetical protein
MPDSPESLSKNRKWFLKKEIGSIMPRHSGQERPKNRALSADLSSYHYGALSAGSI